MSEEWGFPGLVKMTEERLGPCGRPLSTLLILAVSVAILVWAADLVYVKAIEPIITALGGEGLPANLGESLAVYGFGALLYLTAMWLVNRFVLWRGKRVLTQLQLDRAAAEGQYQSYMADLHAIALELHQHGISLKTVPIDPAEETGEASDG